MELNMLSGEEKYESEGEEMKERTILHSDINCCYAAIEYLYHPEFQGKPLAVGGDPEARHGIDESWLDVTDSITLKGQGEKIAEEISNPDHFIRKCGCQASGKWFSVQSGGNQYPG